MIWFNIDLLEHRLKHAILTDRDAFNYLLLNLILYSTIPFMIGYDQTNPWYIGADVLFTILITVVGNKIVFDINNRGDQADFFKRYVSLSFVVGVRMIVLILLIFVPSMLVVEILNISFARNDSWQFAFDFLMMNVSGIVYYYMLANSFKRVSTAAAESAVSSH